MVSTDRCAVQSPRRESHFPLADSRRPANSRHSVATRKYPQAITRWRAWTPARRR